MEVERTEVHDLAVEDGAVAARVDGGMRRGTPDPCHRRGQVDLEAGQLAAHVIGIDVAGARPKPACDCEKVSHDVGGRLPGRGRQVRQAVELSPPVPAIWPFLDLPHMQGPQDLMSELSGREGVRSASRGRDGGRDLPEPVPQWLPGDPRTETGSRMSQALHAPAPYRSAR